ncbi:MAG: Nif3-like dinuclear metal center hexameric protein [Desulfobacteraceae bacterium]|nr:Nif3-like dinuclear metal center hexameric protein [Desulfobacteraceae bacterium]
MKPTTKDLLKLVDAIAPFDLAEEWDNSGLQVGNKDWPAGRVLVALDVTVEVMADAVEWGADLVLTHHPLMIRPQRSFDFGSMPGSAVAVAAANRISIVSAHTNLDKALDGLNEHFAQKIGLVGVSQFQPSIPGIVENTPDLGRMGALDQPMPLFEFADRIKSSLGIPGLRVVGSQDRMVKKAAVCTGSGASLVQAFLGSGADVFITGDMKYHEAREIEQAGLALIDVGHFASEHIVVELLVQRLVSSAETAGFEIDVRGFDGETDPFIMV